MTDHAKVLANAAAEYRRLLDAREKLIKAIREAQADNVRQVDILEAIDHLWTREQVRKLGKDGDGAKTTGRQGRTRSASAVTRATK
jgi:hypothetical protein